MTFIFTIKLNGDYKKFTWLTEKMKLHFFHIYMQTEMLFMTEVCFFIFFGPTKEIWARVVDYFLETPP